MDRYGKAGFFIKGLALALATLAGAGCRAGDLATDDTVELAPQSLEDNCVDFQGFRHCSLGGAQVIPREDGKVLDVNRIVDPGRDGVSVALPDVTSFRASGRVDGSAPGSTLSVRAAHGDETIGTMTMRRLDNGYYLSAAFTGSSRTGAYNVNLYNGDALVGMMANVPNGTGVVVEYAVLPWWIWWWFWDFPDFWNIQSGAHAGACVWSVNFAQGDEIRAVLDDGATVVADRVELEEVVAGAGSYPYMSFNRIDYTGGARMLFVTEDTVNPEP